MTVNCVREESLKLQKVMGEASRESVGGDKPCVPPKARDGERVGTVQRHVLPFRQA